jgi:hypothetical protein
LPGKQCRVRFRGAGAASLKPSGVRLLQQQGHLDLRRSIAMAEARMTTDHETIRRWAEKRGARPARVKGTGEGDDPGVLRLDFGEPEESLEEISWDEFFEKFEENELALLYQDETGSGRESRFNKLVDRSQQH